MRDWLKELRDDIEQTEDSPVDEQTLILAEYLTTVTHEWKYSLGANDVTVQLAFAVQSTAEPNNALENRLLETMKCSHAIRTSVLEAQTLLRSSNSFGDAILSLCQTTSEDAEDISITFPNKDPLTIGVDALAEVARARRLPLLKLFSLVTQCFESSFVSKRNELVAEGLARSDKSLSREERRKQSIQAADSLLDDEKKEGINFLHKLAVASTATK